MNWKETGSQNVIRVDCFLCDDASGHVYIYLASGEPNGFCFRCQTFVSKRRLEKAFGELPRSSDDLAFVHSLDRAVKTLQGRLEEEELPIVELPESVPALEDKRSRSYLRQRQVPEYLSLQHNLRFCTEGQYRFRIIIPVYFKRKVRTFVARDITEKQPKKYLFPRGIKSGSLLFNFDSIGGKSIIVSEGPFDALHLQKFGLPAVAAFGKKLTLAQQELLKRFEKIVIFFDSDAMEETYRYMQSLKNSKVVLLPEGDPTNHKQEAIVNMLRHRLSQIEVAEQVLRFSTI